MPPGSTPWPGPKPTDPRALRLLARHGVRLAGLLLLGAALAGTAAATQASASPKAKPRTAAAAPPAAVAYAGHAEADAFAQALAAEGGPPLPWLQHQLAQARRIDAVRRLIMPPPAGTAKDWAAYRARFIEPKRVAAGVVFWRDNESWLREAEDRWGVPPEVVVGIVGVETFYGRIMGSFRVLDALATLSFDFPPGRRDRSAFFRSELEAFLRWCHAEGLDPTTVKGSYAGAIGLPQFMPGSILRWAVDFDGDGHIDLRRNAADVVGSVAHYLAAFGWERGLPTHHVVAAPVDTADRAVLLAPDILPTFSAAQLAERGAVLDEAGRVHDGPLALVELQNGSAAPSYVAGTRNFWAITRYNWSAYYAMAVIDLGAAVKAERGVRAAQAAPAAPAAR
jgi:membrane-bound lytic murein transglycosylase B